MNDDEFRDLIERTHAIQELTRTPGWQYLVDRAHASIAPRQKAVLDGNPKNMEDYRRATGWIDGALAVLDIPAVVAREIDAERRARAERSNSGGE